MNISLPFIRVLFVVLSVLFLTTYTTTLIPGGFTLTNFAIGVTSGLAFGLALISTESLFKKFNLRSFNIATLGLFFGYLLGEAVFLIFNSVLNVTTVPIEKETLSLLRVAIFLSTAYIGMIMTALAADELYVSLPFIKFKPTSQKKKDLLLDASILMDPRILDLAASGILDHHLILPRFLVKELQIQAETGDEQTKIKARRALEVIKKLEGNPNLELRYIDTDFADLKDMHSKLIKLARMVDANLLTADISRIQQSSIEGIRIINIHLLSNALKPITQSGEVIHIRIQRLGKDARQGVGYLEDGTMVVVNGGAEALGQVIRAQVLSVKHTQSGRLIFCNAVEEDLLNLPTDIKDAYESLENATKNYFAAENNY